MKRLALFIALSLLTCSCSTPPPPAKAELPVESVQSAIEKGIKSNGWLDAWASIVGPKIGEVGPVFIDGNKGRARFVFENKHYEGQASLEKTTDGKWYVTFISIPDVQQGSATVNVPVE